MFCLFEKMMYLDSFDGVWFLWGSFMVFLDLLLRNKIGFLFIFLVIVGEMVYRFSSV